MVARRVVSSLVQRQVKYITPVAPGAAGGLTAAVYRQCVDELRLVVPPVLLHSPSEPVLAAYWMLQRETLSAAGRVDRLAKEAVAAAVSVANICPYCVDMHSVGMYELATEHDAEAIVADRAEEIDDPRIRALAEWARTAHEPDAPLSGDPPFGAAERSELVGVVVAFHYLSRMVNVFLSSFLLPPGLSPAARRRLKHGVSRLLAPILRSDDPPGRAVGLLAPADLPPDARWAEGNEAVAGAVARACAAFDAAGRRSLPADVRDLVRSRLSGWRGEEPGLSRVWCEDLMQELSPADRAAGRLALLVAFASYQVDEDVVAEFRRAQPGDRELVEAVAWAGFATARRIGAAFAPRPADRRTI